MIIRVWVLKWCVASMAFAIAICPAQSAQIAVSTPNPKQGQTIEVVALESHSSSGADALAPHTVKFNGNTYKLFAQKTNEGAKYTALLGIPADLKPGKYPLFVGTDKMELGIKDGKFPVQHLTLPKSKDNFLMSPGEKEAIEGAKATVSDTRRWHGVFMPPSKFRMSAGFGLRRVVNGKLLPDYFHSGLDFAAPAGSPIVACSEGKVVLAAKGYRLHGNVVAIDHGQGVVSFYIHMKTIDVKAGDDVSSGQKIGTVGATGRATGPHLHYSIYINQVATNPREWFKHAF